MKLKLVTKLLAVLAVAFVLIGIVTVWQVRSTNKDIIERQAKDLADALGVPVKAMRAVYTANVVMKLKKEGEQGFSPGQVKGSPTFQSTPGEIPLPATMVHLVSEEAEKMTDLAKFTLLSKWNLNEKKGLNDAFQVKAFDEMLRQQEELKKNALSDEAYLGALKTAKFDPYMQIETIGGKPVLRYAIPDTASAPGCVSCHNALEQKPEIQELRRKQGIPSKTFVLGEVMGILENQVPLDVAGDFANKKVNTLIVILIGMLAAVLAAIFVLSKRATGHIESLTRVANKIVTDGDLSQKIDTSATDEVGQLAISFSRLVEKLREIPASLQQSVQLLNDQVANLASSATEQNQTVTRQAAALQETQVTAQEIKQTSLLAAQKAEVVLKVAERADTVSRSGEAMVSQSLGGLADIRTQTDEITKKINELSERTRQIGEITQTVKDLADQSNMLALNAAIEAVRSGEHGKGFAVVAREIRSLADQSIRATDRVREILTDISSGIGESVAITEKGSEKMEVGITQVKSSGENMRELANIVVENTSAVRQIAAAVNQQNSGISQIFTAVTDQNKMMDDTMKRLKATNESVEVLKGVTQRITDIMRQYRV